MRIRFEHFRSVQCGSGSGSSISGHWGSGSWSGFQYFYDQKLLNFYSWKKDKFFKNPIAMLFEGLHIKLPSSENVQHLKHEISSRFSYFCGKFLPSWIRIQPAKINADPDPQQWFEKEFRIWGPPWSALNYIFSSPRSCPDPDPVTLRKWIFLRFPYCIFLNFPTML
jgi:hypothetical protein